MSSVDFHNPHVITKHLLGIMTFHDSKVIDESGGYFQGYSDDGLLFDPSHRHLVNSARMVANYALVGRLCSNQVYLNRAQHGIEYLEEVHWQANKQCYAWTLRDHQPEILTEHAYGYAFVLLAYASAKKTGLIESNDQRFLTRALKLAENICVHQSTQTHGLIWEHYDANFDIDWEYNRADPKNRYRPGGFQVGHQTQWSKLLLILHRHAPQQWMIERAKSLFDRSWATAWDGRHGGLVYALDESGKWCDDDKYYWVQAETLAAACEITATIGSEEYCQ